MSWREKTVCRILMLVCKIVNSDDKLTADLRNLDNHISTYKEESRGE